MRSSDLTLRYGDKIAFEDVSIDIAKGEITALVGPSGCGKSSFLQSLNRLTDLIPNCRLTGEITLDGVSIRSGSTDLIALRRRVGLIFQKPNPFPYSIRRNIEFPLKEHGVKSRTERLEIIERRLVEVGLWDEVKDRLDQPALALSGGQQQRLCIARSLALNPEVLLLDEPCSALDPISSDTVEDLMLRLRGAYTLVVVTHNLAQARRIASKVGLLWVREDAGRLIEFGSAEQIFEQPEHELTKAYVTGRRG
jgi:phosphate transport system ATP-binding protein